jgi:hypothetical protein
MKTTRGAVPKKSINENPHTNNTIFRPKTQSRPKTISRNLISPYKCHGAALTAAAGQAVFIFCKIKKPLHCLYCERFSDSLTV